MRTKVFVISLDGHPRGHQFRRAAIEGAGSERFEFFNAHRELRGGLEYRERDARIRVGRHLTPAELGCYSSHYATWQWLVDSEFDQLLVLEDDVVADWSFLDMLCTQDLAAMGINYLKLFSKIPPASWKTVSSPFIDLYYHLIQITSDALGAQGYFLTREGAKRMLAAGARVDAAVDVLMDRYWHTNLPILAIHPSPLFERYRASTIGDNRFDKAVLSPAEKISRIAWRLNGRLHRELETRRPLRQSLRQIRDQQARVGLLDQTRNVQAGECHPAVRKAAP